MIFTPSEHTELIELKADFVYEVSTITFINSMSANPGNIERTVNLPNGQEIGEHLADPVGSGLGYRFVGWYRDDGSSVDEFATKSPYSLATHSPSPSRWWQGGRRYIAK